MAGQSAIGAQGLDDSRKNPDELVLVDAYWIKMHNGKPMKIRVLPHQKVVDLYVEFVYKYDDDGHDKTTAPVYTIKFDIPNSCYDGKTKISVNSGMLQKWDPVQKYDGELQSQNGKEVYYYKIPKFTSDLYYVKHRSTIDEIVLKDAYWEKDGMKIRILPHQKQITLKVVFGFKYNIPSCNKEQAVFHLKVAVPNSVFPFNKEIKITGSDLLQCEKADVKDEGGNDCYIYEIENFTSDLSEVEFDN
ncbi:MAG: hypothetical protein II859_06680 [Bacteroidales bacterium]|nr:hypothetical protein [Bacteroidales bacterium]